MGLSDHHLFYYMLKTTFKKKEQKRYKYDHYKKFNNMAFHMDLQSKRNKGSKAGKILKRLL